MDGEPLTKEEARELKAMLKEMPKLEAALKRHITVQPAEGAATAAGSRAAPAQK